MQDRFNNNNNNKKGFDLGKAWRDIKTAYIVNLAIVLTVVLAILITMFVLIPSRNKSHQEGREEGRELGLTAGYNKGYETAKKDIILRLIIAGIEESYVWTFTDSDPLLVSPIFRELKGMSDKQIVEFKNIDIYTFNRLRKIGKIYNSNKIECVKQLMLDKKKFWANRLSTDNAEEEENPDKPENQEPTQNNESTGHEE